MSRKKIIAVVVTLILIVGGYYTYKGVHFYSTHAETEDAQVDGHISPVLPRVSGQVTAVHVDDNEPVKSGQVLVEIDTTEYALKVEMAKSALENARASYEVAKTNVESARIALDKAQTDFNRAQDLYKGGADTRKRFEDAQAALKAAKAKYKAAQRKIEEIKTMIRQKKDNLDYAQLQLSYTQIKAPISGLVSKKDVETGQFVQAGQPVMAVTNPDKIWITANYKETEIHDIKVGQIVKVSVDAYPNKTFRGKVQSIAGATGAKYALLPPENATGNFVKVVQRVPVKIVFTEKSDPNYPMPLGINVTTSIDITQDIDSGNQLSHR